MPARSTFSLLALLLAGALSLAACRRGSTGSAPTAPTARANQQKRAEAEAGLQRVFASSGIHDRGETVVHRDSPEALARSFVAVMADGDRRSALALLVDVESLWDGACEFEAGGQPAQALGGLMVEIPRHIGLVGVDAPVQLPRLGRGQKLDGCPLKADADLATVRVRWRAPQGAESVTQLDVVRVADGGWGIHHIPR